MATVSRTGTERMSAVKPPPPPPEIEGVDICAYEPSAAMVKGVREAIGKYRLRGWMKDQIRAAGGEVVECEKATLIGGAMALGCLMHPRWGKYVEQMGDELVGERLGLLHCLGTPVSTREATVRAVRGRLWLGEAVPRRVGLQDLLQRGGGKLIAGEDVVGVAREMPKRRKLFKAPRFVVVWPRGDEGLYTSLTLTGLREDAPNPQRRLEVRWTCEHHGYMWRRGKAARRATGGRVDTNWGTVPCDQPVTVVDLYRAANPQIPADDSPGGLVGMRGSGILALGFAPGWMELKQGERGAEAQAGRIDSIVKFYASLMEILLEWAERERIDWAGMGWVARKSVLEGLGWVEVKRGEKREARRLEQGSLVGFEEKVVDYVVDVRRGAVLEVAEREREAARARLRMGWEDKPGGMGIGEGLREAVEKGVVRAGYVMEGTRQVAVLLPRICFTQAEGRVVRGQGYPAGVYELPDMWLWLMAPVREEEILALGADGTQHPHPHVYSGRGGVICWGRTDGMATGVEGEISFGQYAVDTLYTKGWREFVDVIVGFFSQWHDTTTYVPLVVQSKWLGEVGSDATR